MPLFDPAPDLADLHALQAGDDHALNRLIARWQRPLLAFAYRYLQNEADARDLTAEAFVRLYQQRARLRVDTHLSSWLFTALANLCHNHHRWKRRHPTVAIDVSPNHEYSGLALADTLSDNEPGPSAVLQHDEEMDALRAAIARLPHDLRTTLLLHHYEQLSYREIATVVGCSERGVETRLYRARQRLRDDLAAERGAASRGDER